MILEYLFLDNEYKEELESYSYRYDVKNKGEVTRRIEAIVTMNEFSGTEHWTLKIEVNGNDSMESAKHLSKINDNIIKYNPIVLENESSAYFNRLLYPLVNYFERNLRKFLYLKSNLSPNQKTKQVIENLERLTFEQIYIKLFVDNRFCKAAHSYTEKTNYSRLELIEKLKSFDENTLWDTIVEPTILTLIKEDFLKMKDYRNDIMHAHNISYETYTSAKKIFSSANIQLLAEIENLLKYPNDTEKSNALVNALDSTLNEETTNIFKQALENSSNFIDILNMQKEKWKNTEESLRKWSEVIKFFGDLFRI